MVIRPTDKKNYLISGFFVVLLSILAMTSVFFISGENSIFTTKIELNTVVTNAENLKEGASVQLKGVQVGKVSGIEFLNVNQLRVSLSIDEKYKNWIREDSYVALKTQGVLGDMFIEILGGTNESKVIENGEELSVQEGPSIDKFIGQGEDILIVASRVLGRLDDILAAVEDKKISMILDNLESSSRSTKTVMSSLEKQDISKTFKNLNLASIGLQNSLGNIEKLTGRIEKGPGTLHSLIYDRSVHDDLKSILGGALIELRLDKPFFLHLLY
jgi:phospholipid/cholesterol/gamma-HCH transport system substrate-binding protein